MDCREKIRITEDEEKRLKEYFEDDILLELLVRLVDSEIDMSIMTKPLSGDFYKEAMDFFIAKGKCVSLEQFKHKLKSYMPEGI